MKSQVRWAAPPTKKYQRIDLSQRLIPSQCPRPEKEGCSFKKRQTPHPKINLTDDQYNQRLLTLLEAREAQHNHQNVYFDLGRGERPQVVKAEFDYVARREKIPV